MRLRMPKSRIFVSLCLFWMMSAGSGWAANATKAAPPMGLSITADRLEMDDKSQIAVFMGHVIADDGRMRLESDRMTVYYDKKGKGGLKGGGVREVKAEGKVILQQERDKGVADVVHYILEKQTLELTGKDQDASIRRGDDLLTGRRILVTLDQEKRISKVSVQGNENHRVSARITSSGLMQRLEAPLRENASPDNPSDATGVEGGGEQPKPPTEASKTPIVEAKPIDSESNARVNEGVRQPVNATSVGMAQNQPIPEQGVNEGGGSQPESQAGKTPKPEGDEEEEVFSHGRLVLPTPKPRRHLLPVPTRQR